MDPNDYGVVEMLLSFGVVLAFLLLGLAGQKEEARTRAPGTRRPIIASRGYHRGMRKGSIARTIGRDSRSSDRLSWIDSRRSPKRSCATRLRQ